MASRRGPRRRCAGRSISRSGSSADRAERRADVIDAPRARAVSRPRASARSRRASASARCSAIGLLTPQPLLLADEPFDGLDLRQSREVGAALRAHAAAGRTLFLSIHSDQRRRARLRSVRPAERRARLRRGHARGADRRCAPNDALAGPVVDAWRTCSLRSRRTRVRVAPREGMARAAGVARLVGDARADRPARRRLVHQRGAHLRRAERPATAPPPASAKRSRRWSASGRRRSARASSRPRSCCRSSPFAWSPAIARAAR